MAPPKVEIVVSRSGNSTYTVRDAVVVWPSESAAPEFEPSLRARVWRAVESPSDTARAAREHFGVLRTSATGTAFAVVTHVDLASGSIVYAASVDRDRGRREAAVERLRDR